jgi:hypothetical protein
VPYVGRRTAFLTYETHQAFHEQYADAMRIRMRALVDARFATSNEPLLQLRDEHQVTHLLVYLPDVRGERLGYFEPFDQWIDEARRASAGKRLVIETLVDQYAVFSDDTYVLIDLRGLSDPT